MTEAQLYAEASRIIQIAMGKEKVSRGRGRKAVTNWRADEDPLAYWCGVEAIVSLVDLGTLRAKLSQEKKNDL
ncbi:hypothetical protein A6U86_05685 [Rhizobium sp. AC27/96]|uniref:hypothetical protein n=1 Tax=Rhizobium sp. AC27/96 TaxID=1841653 RepID=UPI000828E0BA|nr:hypothetical protein [Rhizobium sp. AC27/96]OCJ12514.1 hypothetical protein A6U86_05685 [Rhizobium sp. AC27/96]